MIGIALLIWCFENYIETEDLRYLVIYILVLMKCYTGSAAYENHCRENGEDTSPWFAIYYILFRIV